MEPYNTYSFHLIFFLTQHYVSETYPRCKMHLKFIQAWVVEHYIHSFMHSLSMAAFQYNSRVETIWPPNPKRLINLVFYRKSIPIHYRALVLQLSCTIESHEGLVKTDC